MLAKPGVSRPNMTNRTSQLPGFYKVTVDERRSLLSEATGVSTETMAAALDGGGLSAETADKFVENVLGTYGLPYGVTLNVRVNGQDHVVPMVVEEPSVVAAASNAAKMVRAGGGFHVESRRAHDDQPGPARAREGPRGRDARDHRRRRTRSWRWPIAAVPGLVARGGGARGLDVRELGERRRRDDRRPRPRRLP